MNPGEFFVYFILPPLILILGLFGNLIGLLVLLRPKLEKIGPRVIYGFLFIMDTFFLIQIIHKYLQIGLNLNLDNVSSFWCKFNRYFNYSQDAISPMLLVYISIEKYISIKYPYKRQILNKTANQIIFSVCCYMFNCVYYLPISFYQDLVDHSNNSNVTVIFCDFISQESQTILSMMDLVNLVIIPFILMVVFSFLLMSSIFRSRRRVMTNYTSGENKTFKRDIKLAITSISLNLIYLILNVPLSIVSFTSNFTDFIFYLCVYIFFASYAVNFYTILFTNSLFRKEFFSLILRRNTTSSGPNRTTYFETYRTN